jgi:starvation-inducible DNA-binding protein
MTTTANRNRSRINIQRAVEGVDDALTGRLVGELNQALANLTHLAMDYKQAHWNVVGRDFAQLHKLFDKFTDQTRTFADLAAERAVMFGSPVHGTLHAAAKATQLPPFPEEARDETELLEQLVVAIQVVDECLARAIDVSEDEPRTQDVFVEIARGIEMQRWMLQSHLR